MSGEKKKAGFEECMLRLEQIVHLLEKGDTPLDEAMKLFEEGTKLAKSCDDMLNKAEKRINDLPDICGQILMCGIFSKIRYILANW